MAFPAVPRNAKSYDIENAINRILRWLNPGFGSDNAGKVLASNSNGTDLEWAAPTLSYLTDALAADVALNDTSTWFTGPSVAQGTTGIWLAIGTVTVQDTAGSATLAARITDGTTTAASAVAQTQAASAPVAITLVAVFDTPAADIRIQAIDATSTSGKILYNAASDALSSTLTVVRIG